MSARGGRIEPLGARLRRHGKAGGTGDADRLSRILNKNARLIACVGIAISGVLSGCVQRPPYTPSYYYGRPGSIPTMPWQPPVQVQSPASAEKPIAEEAPVAALPTLPEHQTIAVERGTEPRAAQSAQIPKGTLGFARPIIDFGGQKVGGELPSLFEEAGGPQQSGFWPPFISNAFAHAPPNASCYRDAALQSSGPKTMATGVPVSQYSTVDYLPGLNHVPWGEMVNDHFIVLSGVGVLRAQALPTNDITLEIYPHWSTIRDKGSAKPAYTLPAVVQTHRAQNGFVLRLFVRSESPPITCVDVLIPYSGFRAAAGRIHYGVGSSEYVARFVPARLTR